MKIVIQRVLEASVSVKGQIHSCIGPGMLIFIGIQADDTAEDIQWLTGKICNLRIFNDENGVMNRSVLETDGEIWPLVNSPLWHGLKRETALPILMPPHRISPFLFMKISWQH